MFFYHFYGIYIESEIKLYNIDETPAVKADVLIHYGEPDEDILEYRKRNITSTMNPERVWYYNDIGIFIVKKGKEIVVCPHKDHDELELGSFVLGWGIAFLFHQRGYLAIHSTALEMNGKAVLISGASGAGKSTTALELIKRGYRYLADDIAMVNVDGDMAVEPGFPIQKVCRDVAESIEDDKLIYINEKKDKFAYKNTGEFCDESRIISKIFFIEKDSGEEVRVERRIGLDKWNAVANSLFLLDAYRSLGFPDKEKKDCLKLAGVADFITIRRPENKNSLKEICDFIERESAE